nr:hypothetical protein CFP56_03785 [Quercus suber]
MTLGQERYEKLEYTCSAQDAHSLTQVYVQDCVIGRDLGWMHAIAPAFPKPGPWLRASHKDQCQSFIRQTSTMRKACSCEYLEFPKAIDYSPSTTMASLTVAVQTLSITIALAASGSIAALSVFDLQELKSQPAERSLPMLRWLFSRGSHIYPPASVRYLAAPRLK